MKNRLLPAAPPRLGVLLLSLCMALSMSGNSIMIVTTGIAGYSIAEAKWLATLPIALQHLANMATSFPASFLMRRVGRQRGFMVGCGLGMMGALLCAKAMMDGSFPLLCLGSVLVGMSMSHAQYYRFAAPELAPPSFRAKAISLVMAGGVLAAIIGPNLASQTLDLLAPVLYAGTYLSMTGLYVVSILVLLFVPMPPPSREEIGGPQRPLAAIMRQPMFIAAAGAGMISYGVMALLMTATPLIMGDCDFPFSDTTFIIQWHILGMYVPSFFTGWLIARFGVFNVMLAGIVAFLASVAINLSGLTLGHFWAGLVLLGIGWNFLFIGGTTLLTGVYTPAERAKVQAVNDFLVFGTVAAAALSAGTFHALFGWATLNYLSLPMIGLALAMVLRQRLRMRAAEA